MSSGVISFLLAVGSATWIFTKFQRYSGNNTKQSTIAAAISALFIFIVAFAVLNLILK
jgi:hypothetical protein